MYHLRILNHYYFAPGRVLRQLRAKRKSPFRCMGTRVKQPWGGPKLGHYYDVVWYQIAYGLEYVVYFTRYGTSAEADVSSDHDIGICKKLQSRVSSPGQYNRILHGRSRTHMHIYIFWTTTFKYIQKSCASIVNLLSNPNPRLKVNPHPSTLHIHHESLHP